MTFAARSSGAGSVRSGRRIIDLLDARLGELAEPADVVVDRAGVDGGGVAGRILLSRSQPVDQLGDLPVVGTDERGRQVRQLDLIPAGRGAVRAQDRPASGGRSRSVAHHVGRVGVLGCQPQRAAFASAADDDRHGCCSGRG